jgi:hypothetical protein
MGGEKDGRTQQLATVTRLYRELQLEFDVRHRRTAYGRREAMLGTVMEKLADQTQRFQNYSPYFLVQAL